MAHITNSFYEVRIKEPEGYRVKPDSMSFEEWCKVIDNYRLDQLKTMYIKKKVKMFDHKRKCDAVKYLKKIKLIAPEYDWEVNEYQYISLS